MLACRLKYLGRVWSCDTAFCECLGRFIRYSNFPGLFLKPKFSVLVLVSMVFYLGLGLRDSTVTGWLAPSVICPFDVLLHMNLCSFLTGLECTAIYWSVILSWDSKLQQFQAHLHGLWHIDQTCWESLYSPPRESNGLSGFVHHSNYCCLGYLTDFL